MKEKIAILMIASIFVVPMISASVQNTLVEESTGCADLESGAIQHVEESDWISLNGGSAAQKKLTLEFTSRELFSTAGNTPEDPSVTLENCSHGVCTVIITIYETATASVKFHAGTFAWVWGFMKAGVEQEIMVTEDSVIECNGEAIVLLKMSGGVGPRTAYSTFRKDHAGYVSDTCSYLNIGEIDTSCSMKFVQPFDISAQTPGRFTKFDVFNGGRIVNSLADSPDEILGTVEVGDTAVETSAARGISLNGLCLRTCAGTWSTTYNSIEIDVDMEEARKLLFG